MMQQMDKVSKTSRKSIEEYLVQYFKGRRKLFSKKKTFQHRKMDVAPAKVNDRQNRQKAT